MSDKKRNAILKYKLHLLNFTQKLIGMKMDFFSSLSLRILEYVWTCQKKKSKDIQLTIKFSVRPSNYVVYWIKMMFVWCNEMM